MTTDSPAGGRSAATVGQADTTKAHPHAAGQPEPITPRAHTLRFQGLANRAVRVLLRTPLICRALGRVLITVEVIGRKSGRRYVVPVAYTRHEGALLIGTPFAWARNLRSGTPVTIRVKGRSRLVDVEVITGEAGVIDAYAVMARDNHNFASFNQIGIGADGEPDPADVQLAWAAGARAIRLTPR